MNTATRLLSRSGLCALAFAAFGLATSASAQTPASDSAMVNLIRLLVQQGVLTQDKADVLMQQALTEAAQAKAVPVAAASDPAALPAPAPGSQRVTYVPEVVKNQLRDEIRQQVLAEVKDQRWALPEALPEWINRLEWSGDVRVRNQSDMYADINTDEFLDFAQFNANGPTDINPTTNPNGLPFLNTREDRLDNLRLRARLGLRAKVTDEVSVGVRLATGSTNSPVSTNEAFGGGLAKKDLWLDQAYVNIRPVSWATFVAGRMPNPFVSTDLVYDDDLNFDGAALRLAYHFGDDDERGFGIHASGGGFPLQYVDNNFPSNSVFKAESRTKWLFGGQFGASWNNDVLEVRADAAYYDFHGVQGRLSEPCALVNGNQACSTDSDRPAFMQKGNTLFLLRDIIPDPANPLNYAQPQFAGLALDYKLVDLTASIDWRVTEDLHLALQGDFVKNIGYDETDLCRYAPFGLPVNNIEPSPLGNVNPCGVPPATPGAPADQPATFASGDTGWMVKAAFGHSKLNHRGQWSIAGGYKYLEPDAVVDGYTDSDFHLGGTNAQGYFVSGSLVIYDNTRITARWLSANEVYGPPLQIDVGQLDLSIGF
ncbi:MAG: putative porin [Caulobacteraceae bacterium]